MSGNTIPPAVVSLASSRSTTTRSPSGFSFIAPVSFVSLDPENQSRRSWYPSPAARVRQTRSSTPLLCNGRAYVTENHNLFLGKKL